MQTPEEVAAMLRLKGVWLGIRRIAGELGCSRTTVRGSIAAGGRGRQRQFEDEDGGACYIETHEPETYAGHFRLHLVELTARRLRF
jgi:hypothetical protein